MLAAYPLKDHRKNLRIAIRIFLAMITGIEIKNVHTGCKAYVVLCWLLTSSNSYTAGDPIDQITRNVNKTINFKPRANISEANC